ncbi:MAG: hypothetical protein ACRDIC_09080 [bacterium]
MSRTSLIQYAAVIISLLGLVMCLASAAGAGTAPGACTDRHRFWASSSTRWYSPLSREYTRGIRAA